jgi:predicted nucleotidyltransferase
VADPDDGTHVRVPTIEDVARICRSLNESGARYLLIGGFAVIAHGAGRTTKDVDFLVDDAPENIAKVKKALGILADNAASEMDDDDVRTYTVVRVADEVMVDLLGRACGLSYADAMTDAESREIGGVPVPVASKRTLIRTKDTFRPQDAADRRFLESLEDHDDG